MEKEITLSLDNLTSIKCTAKQNDNNTRNYKVTLTENNKPITIPKDAKIKIRYKRQDGKGDEIDAEVVDNKVILKLTDEMLAIEGTTYIDIAIEKGLDTLSSSVLEVVTMGNPVIAEKITGSSEFIVLNEALNKADKVLNDANVILPKAEKAVINANTAADKAEKAAKSSEGIDSLYKTKKDLNSDTSIWHIGYMSSNIPKPLPNSNYVFSDYLNFLHGEEIKIRSSVADNSKMKPFIYTYNKTLEGEFVFESLKAVSVPNEFLSITTVSDKYYVLAFFKHDAFIDMSVKEALSMFESEVIYNYSFPSISNKMNNDMDLRLNSFYNSPISLDDVSNWNIGDLDSKKIPKKSPTGKSAFSNFLFFRDGERVCAKKIRPVTSGFEGHIIKILTYRKENGEYIFESEKSSSVLDEEISVISEPGKCYVLYITKMFYLTSNNLNDVTKFIKGVVINDKSASQILNSAKEYADSKLQKKFPIKLVTYGDSLFASGNDSNINSWQKKVIDYFGIKEHVGVSVGGSGFCYFNRTFSLPDGFALGKSLPNGAVVGSGSINANYCSWERITKTIPRDADLIIIGTGANDMGTMAGSRPIPFVTSDKTDTAWANSEFYSKFNGDYNIKHVEGAVMSTVMKLSCWCPNAKIVITNWCNSMGNSKISAQANTFKEKESMDLIDKLQYASNLCGAHFIDLYHNSGINQWNRDKYTKDTIHLNPEGYMLMGDAIIAGIKAVLI